MRGAYCVFPRSLVPPVFSPSWHSSRIKNAACASPFCRHVCLQVTRTSRGTRRSRASDTCKRRSRIRPSGGSARRPSRLARSKPTPIAARRRRNRTIRGGGSHTTSIVSSQTPRVFFFRARRGRRRAGARVGLAPRRSAEIRGALVRVLRVLKSSGAVYSFIHLCITRAQPTRAFSQNQSLLLRERERDSKRTLYLFPQTFSSFAATRARARARAPFSKPKPALIT